MGNTYFNANSENNLQRLLYSFNQSTKQRDMIINTNKTKCLVTSKELVRCKLEVDPRMIEQVNQFKYLGADIRSSGNLANEVREQTTKASKTSGCLRDIVWRNE
ncbi:hypothetical protein Trydic_g7143 [Trypoxylus dichotomus]